MFDKMDNPILVLAPHVDDGELGCGGSIAKFCEEGKEIYYAAFSIAEASLPEGLPTNTLEIEVSKATQELGIASSNLIIKKYPVRRLNYYRQDILEDLVTLKKELNPALVFTPTVLDLHQDHSTVTQECLRAFKTTSILGYELPWNNMSFHNDFFIKLSKSHVEKKMAALKHYQSQKDKNYFSDDFVWGLARTRGVQVSMDFAETFELIRGIIR